jgi:hypothetical protein
MLSAALTQKLLEDRALVDGSGITQGMVTLKVFEPEFLGSQVTFGLVESWQASGRFDARLQPPRVGE